MRRQSALGVALTVLAVLWLSSQAGQAEAGSSTGWIFQPSYADCMHYDPYMAAKYHWRQGLFYGGRATGHAIYGYRHNHVRLGSFPGHQYTGSSSTHIWQSYYSVPSGL